MEAPVSDNTNTIYPTTLSLMLPQPKARRQMGGKMLYIIWVIKKAPPFTEVLLAFDTLFVIADNS